MKTLVTLALGRVLTGSLLVAFSKSLHAQDGSQAINFPDSFAAIGYSNDETGWSFVPTVDLLVTGINSSGVQVRFWQGSNSLVAAYAYGGPYGTGLFGGAPTNFQSISPLELTAHETYFISSLNSDSSLNLFIYSRNGIGENTPFTTSPYINGFGCYFRNTNGTWRSPTTPPSENVNYALLGPNFQFQLLSPVLNIQRMGNAVILTWPASRTNFLAEASTGLGQTNWQTLVAPVVINNQWTVTNAIGSGNQFFRLRRQ